VLIRTRLKSEISSCSSWGLLRFDRFEEVARGLPWCISTTSTVLSSVSIASGVSMTVKSRLYTM